jgi:hypothetical protein
MRYGLILGVVLAMNATALAQDNSQPAPCGGEAFKQFDFWIGNWDVTTPDGNLAGENLITSEENGCLILERWQSANGGTGQSYNFYNPATEKWRQVWISQGGMIDYEGGLTESGSMKLEGTITNVATGLQAPFTGEWTPNEDGTVTQYFEQYDAETEQWNPWFSGLYTRKETETR